MKIKMLFDSSVGLTKEEVESKGAGFVPIIITVDDKDYYEGVDMNEEILAKYMLEGNHKFKTAAVSLGMLQDAYREALKDADAVVYLPLSKEMSSTYNNAVMAANEDEFKGKVFVVDSLWASPWTYLHADDLIKKASVAETPEEVVKFAEMLIKDTIIFMSPATLTHLKNGGRISKAEYLAGSLLKIKPIIIGYKGAITDDKHGMKPLKARSVEKAWDKMFDQLKDFLPNLDQDVNYEVIFFSYGEKKQEFENMVKMRASELKLYSNNAHKTVIGASVMAHTGPEIYGLGVKKVVE